LSGAFESEEAGESNSKMTKKLTVHTGETSRSKAQPVVTVAQR